MTVLALVYVMWGVAAEPAPVSLDSLAWLAGCWTAPSEGRQAEEHWMKPAGGTMFGMSRTVAGGKTVTSEFLELRQDGVGVVYVAHPEGQARTTFQWVSGDQRSARFENPAHDFPQTITYALNPDGTLLARIEGMVDGRPRALDFPMRRGGC